MDATFTPDQLKIFGCFITPKYPRAIRSMQAVVQETGLDEDVVLSVFKEFEGSLFQQVDDRWAFNLVSFSVRYHAVYPQLFKEYFIITTPVGIVVGPNAKSACETLEALICSGEQPECVEVVLRQILQSVRDSNKESVADDTDDKVSFAM